MRLQSQGFIPIRRAGPLLGIVISVELTPASLLFSDLQDAIEDADSSEA